MTITDQIRCRAVRSLLFVTSSLLITLFPTPSEAEKWVTYEDFLRDSHKREYMQSEVSKGNYIYTQVDRDSVVVLPGGIREFNERLVYYKNGSVWRQSLMLGQRVNCITRSSWIPDRKRWHRIEGSDGELYLIQRNLRRLNLVCSK